MQTNALSASTLALALGASALTAQSAAQSKVQFQAQILPILERSCARCHSAPTKDARGRMRQPKADLRLDGKGWILKGSKKGAVVVPGNPDESPLYTLTALEPGDPDIMPAKGKPLTSQETGLIKRWIGEGCDFGSWTGASGPAAAEVEKVQSAARPATETNSRLAVWAALGKGVQPALPQAVERAAGRKCQVVPVMPGSPLLRVAFVSNESVVEDRDLEQLAQLAGHITQLGLGRTKISDGALDAIARMQRLTRLDLNRTAVTDAGLEKLAGLQELRYLNLHGTAITSQGVQALGRLAKLESLYLWNTKVDDDGVRKLAEQLPNTKIHHQRTIPSVTRQPRTGDSSRRRRKR